MVELARAATLSNEEKRWLERVREHVLQYVPEAKRRLFGSVARGERTSESDYDLGHLFWRNIAQDGIEIA